MTASLAAATLVRRVLAVLLDYLVMVGWIAVVVAIGFGLRAAAPDLASAVFGDPLSAQAVGFATLTVPIGLYLAVMEAGPRGATLGKRQLGIRVVTGRGADLSIGRSLARTALKLAPWELSHAIIWRFASPGSAPDVVLNAGLVLVWVLIGANVVSALVDPERRTIYDRLSTTRVVVA